MPENKMAARPATDATAVNQVNSTTKYSIILQQLPITLTAKPAIQSCAKHITEGRQRGKHLAASSTSIGTAEQDFEATYYGTLAELILYHWLEEQGTRPEYTLLDTRAVTEADFRLDGLRYEVKCAPPGKAYLAISQRQHHDPRRQCDFYVCALFETSDTIRVCPPIPHAAVSSWARMTNGHEPYYSQHRADLLLPADPQIVRPGQEQHEATTAFFLSLMDAYNDEALRLEVRPAFPAWMQAALYPNGDAPGNWQFLTPRGTRTWFPLTERGCRMAAEHALSLSGRYEVYYGVLPRIGESGKAVDVPAAACLWCDIDGGMDGVEGAQALLDKAVQSGRLPAPHFVVCSGGGLHVYWRLASPVALSDDETRRRFKDLLKRLCLAIGGDSYSAHADTSRADVASILRVPGTFNRKREQVPRAVSLLPSAPTTPHTLTWWKAYLPALPAPTAPKFAMRNPSDPAGYEGLLRWARRPFLEGKRHKDLTSAAAWLVRSVGVEKSLARDLLMMKAQASSGRRAITPEEVEAIITWA